MNITTALSEHAKSRPYDLALITLTEKYDWFSLNDKVNRTASFLAARGVVAGQRCAISVRDQVLHLFVSVALARLGVSQIALPPIDPMAIRQSLVSRLNIEVVVVESLKEGALQKTRGIEISSALIDLEVASTDPTHLCDGDEPFLILQSSGTTGSPKFSELSHRMAFERFTRYKTYFGTSEHDICWPASRLDFVVAKQRAFHCLQSGAALCIVSGRVIDECLLNFLDRTGVTLGVGSPSHMIQILAASRRSLSLPKLRAFEVRSATINETLRRDFMTRVSPGLFVAYATNEMEVATLATPENLRQVVDTVGLPVTGMSVEVVDSEDEVVPNGTAGSIRIAGKGVIDGYLDDPGSTCKSFRNGWFYPGDIGRFVDGQLVFLGRSDDMMIYDGMNIYPIEIENALMQHPSVREVAALPLKHQKFQDVPVAAVVLKSPTNLNELQAHCELTLGLKQPRMLMILESLPTNAMGKTLKREIAKMFHTAASKQYGTQFELAGWKFQ